ncbi:hypothetical protein HYT25_00380 [Candidatus Pacearchaeota archaeon]|nr:hypothetical protein [Candidatus Pacearchaeota archaeon]
MKEENVEGKIVYKCEKCGFYYKTKNFAEKCEDFCKKHKSCNLNITKHAIKIWKKK